MNELLSEAKRKKEAEQLAQQASILEDWARVKEELFSLISLVGTFENRLNQLEYLVAICLDEIPTARSKLDEAFKKYEETEKGKKREDTQKSPTN